MELLIGIFFAGLLAFHWLERKFPPVIPEYKTGLKRRGYLADLTASLVNGPVLSAATKIAAYWVVVQFPALVSDGMSTWPWVLQLAVFLLVNDFARYWLHRWHHASPLLWRIHRVHHTVVEMDALSTFRVHILEAVIKYGVIVLPFHFLHVDTSIILLYSAVDVLKGFWHHANLKTYIGSLNYVFNSAELHWWHHSTEAKGQRSNYGSIFSVWDWLFGTLYYEKGRWPESIGVEGLENFPNTYHGLLTTVRYDDEEARTAYPEPGNVSEAVRPNNLEKESRSAVEIRSTVS
ncbi:MAG: sterol desaturase family protein [Phycisphaerales bacterium]|nr:sterol desaturase family protein [Phycisphaerales bacterium]